MTATSGYTSGGECFTDSSENVAQADGTLKLTARRRANYFLCPTPYSSFWTKYTSGMVSTHTKFAQAYGRFEIRAKFPASSIPGLQSSLWMWPAKAAYVPWPYGGEIDIAEWYSRYPNLVIPYLHHGNWFWDFTATTYTCTVKDVDAWHTYAMEWTPFQIVISYDGQQCLRNVSWPGLGAPFHQPFMVAMTQLLGIGNNAVTDYTPLPATTQIDYVRVWS